MKPMTLNPFREYMATKWGFAVATFVSTYLALGTRFFSSSTNLSISIPYSPFCALSLSGTLRKSILGGGMVEGMARPVTSPTILSCTLATKTMKPGVFKVCSNASLLIDCCPITLEIISAHASKSASVGLMIVKSLSFLLNSFNGNHQQ